MADMTDENAQRLSDRRHARRRRFPWLLWLMTTSVLVLWMVTASSPLILLSRKTPTGGWTATLSRGCLIFGYANQKLAVGPALPSLPPARYTFPGVVWTRFSTGGAGTVTHVQVDVSIMFLLVPLAFATVVRSVLWSNAVAHVPPPRGFEVMPLSPCFTSSDEPNSSHSNGSAPPPEACAHAPTSSSDDVRGEPLLDRLLRLKADKLLDELPVLEQQHGGNPLDAES